MPVVDDLIVVVFLCMLLFNYFTLTAETVSPALVVPIPVVSMERGLSLHMYFKIWDFPAPGK